ncbi:melanoma-associated antigen B2-like [Sorex araneus]|uniref:melanoma-associated antigen B2-like n=1 Tax=Sorex araneus TaxID=42254 RepID=UPI002433BF77|nr:melanoma-associated antigen B2-like [Sorex araneus]
MSPTSTRVNSSDPKGEAAPRTQRRRLSPRPEAPGHAAVTWRRPRARPRAAPDLASPDFRRGSAGQRVAGAVLLWGPREPFGARKLHQTAPLLTDLGEHSRNHQETAPSGTSAHRSRRTELQLPGDHTTVMPRGQKSKLRARERRRERRLQAQDGTPGLQGTGAEAEETPTCSSVVSEEDLSTSCAAAMASKPKKAPSASFSEAGAAGAKSNEGAKSIGNKSAHPSGKGAAIPNRRRRDPISRKAGMLINYLLEKYKMQEPILKEDMLKIVKRKYSGHFPEILRRASERMELVFGLYLKEVKPGGHSFSLVSEPDFSSDGYHSSSRDHAKNGLLMPVLGVIFLNGNLISEKDMWEFLNVLGIYEGRFHLVFGDVKKLLTQDLVKEQYLLYRQLPHSDPPSYVFLWGPRARAEISKMKVLTFLARVNGTCLCAFPEQYEEALKEERERAAASRSFP